ncbi:MAG TPA: AsmA family protein [Casimicrobiaceae bacterium]|nr:AsmA family protein [Casimicrobiaceae bacterium]
MRRTALIVLGVAAGITALILVAAAIAVATVDPRTLVAPVQARIKAATGRTLEIAGPVDLSLSLEPKLVVGDVSFGNAPWGQAKQMLRARKIEARVALLPLIRRRFEVVELVLDHPVITLETDAHGRGNWEFGAAGSATAATEVPVASGVASTLAAIGVANLAVNDGTISWRDGASGKTTEVGVDNLTLHARDFTAPMAIDFRGKIGGTPVALSGEIGPAQSLLEQRTPYPVALKGQVDGTGVRLSTKIARSGTATTFEDLDLAYGAIAARGSLRSVTTAGHTHYVVALDVPSLSLAGGASSQVRPPPPASAESGTPARWTIPDTALPLAAAAALDAEGTLAIAEVKLGGGQRIGKVDARFVARAGQVDLKLSSGAALGGSLTSDVAIDAKAAAGPSLRWRLSAQDIDLGALAAITGNARDIRGGKVRANVDIAANGLTPHRWASSMSGSMLAVSGPATLTGTAGGAESTLSRISALLDPLRGARKATELRCAVIRLPISGGVARVDRSIAVETGEIGVLASGTIDFRNETIDLALQPQLRRGASIDVSQIAGLVRVRGSFSHPGVGVDAAQSAQAIARIGALASKGGGLAALGRALVAPPAGGGEPCAIAMGAKGGPAAREPAAQPMPSGSPGDSVGLPGDLGKAIDKLFGR